MHTKMIQSFNNGTIFPLIHPLNFTVSCFSFISQGTTLPANSSHLQRDSATPVQWRWSSRTEWMFNEMLICWGEVINLGQCRAGQHQFILRSQSSVSGNTWVLSTVGITQLYFDMKAFVTVILAHWDLIRKWNAPVLSPLGSLSLPFIQ